jgi:opacity protein-like surface antigen
MKRVLLVVCGVMAVSTTASAGGYGGLAVGTQPGVSGEFGDNTATPASKSLRGLGGYRFGNISAEGALNGFTVLTATLGERSMYQLSAAAKLNLPLDSGFEAFGRAGIEHTWLDLGPEAEMSGNGFLIGAGVEYRFNLGITTAAVFVDYTIHYAGLRDHRDTEFSATTRMFGLGFTVGL